MKNRFNFLALAIIAGISILSCSKKEVVQMQTQQRQLTDTVSKDPVANFLIYNPFGNTHAPATVGLNNLSSNATSYSWDFGDGVQSNDSFPTHLYTNEGTYTIQLIASNGSKTNKTTQTINILSPYAQISISQILIKVSFPAGDRLRPGLGSLEIYNSTLNRIFSGSDTAQMPFGERLYIPHPPFVTYGPPVPSNRIFDYYWTFDNLGVTSAPSQSYWISYHVNLPSYGSWPLIAGPGFSYSDTSRYNFQAAAFALGTSLSNSYPPTVSVSHGQTTMTLSLQWQ